MILNDAVRQALTAGHLAHLVTLDEDGSPHVSLVWITLDDDEIVCAHMHFYRKLKNIQHDSRVALSMVTEGKTEDLENYLVINGRARVTKGGAPDLLNRLAQVYMGPETVFPLPEGVTSEDGYITRITAERIHGRGPWGK